MNYFEYFTEIETRFAARRGSLLLLSPLDWALIETWREAGVPLAAVLRGIDAAFDKYDARKARARGRLAKVNGLAWCAQAVMTAATDMAEAAIGSPRDPTPPQNTGFATNHIAHFLNRNALALKHAAAANQPDDILHATADRLHQLAAEVRANQHPALDQLDQTLTVLEERLHAALLARLSETDLLAARQAADRHLAPVRTQLGPTQKRQIRDQFVQKSLLEKHHLPRLSLFYMPLQDPETNPS